MEIYGQVLIDHEVTSLNVRQWESSSELSTILEADEPDLLMTTLNQWNWTGVVEVSCKHEGDGLVSLILGFLTDSEKALSLAKEIASRLWGDNVYTTEHGPIYNTRFYFFREDRVNSEEEDEEELA